MKPSPINIRDWFNRRNPLVKIGLIFFLILIAIRIVGELALGPPLSGVLQAAISAKGFQCNNVVQVATGMDEVRFVKCDNYELSAPRYMVYQDKSGSYVVNRLR